MTDRAHGPLELDGEAYGRDDVTPDIDALASHRAVAEEARVMAHKHGLAERWLNDAAGPWVPPRPRAARRRPADPGLTVHIAPPEHVLAIGRWAQEFASSLRDRKQHD